MTDSVYSAGRMASDSSSITDERQTLAQVQESFAINQALQGQINAQSQLMRLLTHQLGTPLTALTGFIDLLAESELTPSERQEFLAVAKQQIHRMQILLYDLVAMRTLETGRLAAQQAGFALPTLVDDVLVDFVPHPVHCLWPEEMPWVWADRWQVSQVLVNLISNAIKYSPNGTPVEIGAKPDELGQMQVWVRDYGLGIPDADKPYLFEQFYRVHHRDRQHIPGTGLGLFICKSLIENQGGQLWVESVHGEGSCFYFTLPLASSIGS